ncbi:hydroxyethylthiazole kinase [Fusibacter ferrireducens]|uniref:hydroxyethylthiazole kinase n=1 Tax=Fusibacter ferrireducens TaxID=2785058 RepID=A0ABR9ZRT8_9FIRM|nr:hydroxyethylthiazole kinase [Fusibacter ferrireducens]MBF4693175.1 hydroxyethylthiazole kinase [Fusibacter ferrireducens]
MITLKKNIHLITNDVTKQFVADTVAAVGASPIMSETPEEYAAIYSKIDAAVINLGMVNLEKQKVIHAACSEAQVHGVPLVIDLVGIHFSAYRKTFALELLSQYDFQVIKGNYDEITVLDSNAQFESFDASNPIALKTIQLISNQYPKAIIVATGKIDYVCQRGHVRSVSGGSPLLPKVSGTGCVLSGLLGVCIANASHTNPFYESQSSNADTNVSLMTLSQIEDMCKAYKSASIRAEISSQHRLGQFKIDLISEISEIEVSI